MEVNITDDLEFSQEISIYLGLVPGRSIQADTAWNIIKEISFASKELHYFLSPNTKFELDLVSGEQGSLWLKFIGKITGEDNLKSGKSTSQAILIALALYVFQSGGEIVKETFKNQILSQPASTADVTPKQKEEIIQEAERRAEQAIKNQEIKESSKRLYKKLDNDESVQKIGISPSNAQKPNIFVDRKDFKRLSLGKDQIETFLTRERVYADEITLVSPVLIKKANRKWEFKDSSHGKFHASINDKEFLDKFYNGDLHVELRPDIRLNVIIKVIEKNDEGFWKIEKAEILEIEDILLPFRQDNFNDNL
ncbi:hypothetical protein [Gluconobacter sp. P5B12]|uniref:hypothetical protein n=2 Tax=unclassified Gluconobacter TaxID=2644261 RepID=UPI001C044995|nr:hypothetical protein [Gluconobacter sp. P5B12]